MGQLLCPLCRAKGDIIEGDVDAGELEDLKKQRIVKRILPGLERRARSHRHDLAGLLREFWPKATPLELSHRPSPKELDKAYKKVVRQFHPNSPRVCRLSLEKKVEAEEICKILSSRMDKENKHSSPIEQIVIDPEKALVRFEKARKELIQIFAKRRGPNDFSKDKLNDKKSECATEFQNSVIDLERIPQSSEWFTQRKCYTHTIFEERLFDACKGKLSLLRTYFEKTPNVQWESVKEWIDKRTISNFR